jgi:hypothetical protein
MTLKCFVKENKHLSRSEFIQFGWGNGYVCLSEDHPCYGMDYSEIHNQYEIDVNGGLTFSDHSKNIKEWSELPPGEWWVVGFDTCHSWDSMSLWPTPESVMRETNKLMNRLTSIALLKI